MTAVTTGEKLSDPGTGVSGSCELPGEPAQDLYNSGSVLTAEPSSALFIAHKQRPGVSSVWVPGTELRVSGLVSMPVSLPPPAAVVGLLCFVLCVFVFLRQDLHCVS